MKLRRTLIAGLAALASRAAAADAPDLETIARDEVRDLADGKYDPAFERFAPPMRSAVPKAAVAAIMDPLRAERSPARSVIVRLRHDNAEGTVTFTVKCNWQRGPVSDVKVTLFPDGTIGGMTIHDEQAPPPPIDRFDRYETKAKLRPPFRGTWTAHNAARDGKNAHFTNPNQRFAVDWVRVGPDGRTFKSDGRSNADYLAYGEEALAPAAGTVALVVDGVPDNVPGQRDPYFVPGNSVAIDLGDGEFAIYAHLIPGSARVKVGQRVAAGDVVGRVGNSGNSSEPHLHFQLADHARLAEAAALPCQFAGALLDGRKVDRATPTDGSRLAAPDAK
jgi:hypothetical protein